MSDSAVSLRVAYGRIRAPYAADPAASRGRALPEPASPTRTEFQRDRDRIIHSTAFRRLAYKTQVFIVHEGDHYRTRLTHTIEVSQMARAIARALGLDEDLTEALALAHDLGHTPFGHAGERALDREMTAAGGFDHNAQSLRIVTALEHRYADHDGLNLSFETLEGIAKHNGPVAGSLRPHAAETYGSVAGLDLASFASLEAQAAAIADDIAYDAHDLDDGLRAGLVQLADLPEVPLVGDLLAEVAARHPGLAPDRTMHELGRRLITRMIEDVIAESGRRIAAAAPGSLDDVRRAGRPLVAFSDAMAAADAAIKRFLFAKVYRAERVMKEMQVAEDIVSELFRHYRGQPDAMPAHFSAPSADPLERRVADFVAGMTDRYAIDEHRRIFDSPLELR